MDRVYFCIDLKTFFASVECVERGLDPFKTDLVVADPDRGRGSVCLAISPSMKNKGIKNRCRVFEIPKNVIPIVAKPRMKKYIEYTRQSTSHLTNTSEYFKEMEIHANSMREVLWEDIEKLTKEDLARIPIAWLYDWAHITANYDCQEKITALYDNYGILKLSNKAFYTKHYSTNKATKSV